MMDHKDLRAIETETWHAIEAACTGPRTPLTWFSLATVSANGRPQQRTVVLRDVDANARRLVLFTDIRTPKIAELTTNPNVACLFLDSEAMLQYRLEGTASVLESGDIWQSYWNMLSENGKRDYASLGIPGETTDSETAYDTNLAKANFAVIEITCETLDWLKLARGGHKRIQFDWRSDKPIANQVTP